MTSYNETDIKAETNDFWVLEVGERGFEVYQKGVTNSTRVASIGAGENLGLGLPRAIQEMSRRQVDLTGKIIAEHLQPKGWSAVQGGAAIASKSFKTAVGLKEAHAYLQVYQDGGMLLVGDYQSEGRNVAEPACQVISGTPAEIRKSALLFAQDVDRLIGESYAARLYQARDLDDAAARHAVER